jgi:hypothetical protein
MGLLLEQGWYSFGAHAGLDVELEFWGKDEMGLPVFERVQGQLFVPVGRSSAKVKCTICGSCGFPGGRWQDGCRLGHRPCPRCGKPLKVTKHGKGRTHGRCPA